MDVTVTIGWWVCQGCGVDAELPGADTAGFELPCPDCGDAMDEQWSWEVAVRERSAAAGADRAA